MPIPRGLTRDHILKAIDDLEAGRAHRFGVSRKYDLLLGGRRYPPKAVLGLGIGHLLGTEPSPHAFTGGEATNRCLRELGFEIVPKT